ncbi:uncharacterized protein UDID_17439 [Ustilago sp. UG-2017a]|nr:uncharacterized protein UDID_17439 [Ustilago sp. UG-2017a]
MREQSVKGREGGFSRLVRQMKVWEGRACISSYQADRRDDQCLCQAERFGLSDDRIGLNTSTTPCFHDVSGSLRSANVVSHSDILEDNATPIVKDGFLTDFTFADNTSAYYVKYMEAGIGLLYTELWQMAEGSYLKHAITVMILSKFAIVMLIFGWRRYENVTRKLDPAKGLVSAG